MSESIVDHGLKIFSLSSNKELAEKIATSMGVELGHISVSHFSDGEIKIAIEESIRGDNVYIIQSTSDPVNDNLMELLIMIDACRRASAETINVVIPYFGYARQDRKAQPREPITAKLVARMMENAGATRILALDLHAAQIQGFFEVPVDHLYGAPLLAEYFLTNDRYTDSDTVTCLILSIRFSSARKIESETTTSSKSESSKRWIAGPDNTGCVQQATTDNAPASLIADAASVMVPAVSIMSSMMMA